MFAINIENLKNFKYVFFEKNLLFTASLVYNMKRYLKVENQRKCEKFLV